MFGCWLLEGLGNRPWSGLLSRDKGEAWKPCKAGNGGCGFAACQAKSTARGCRRVWGWKHWARTWSAVTLAIFVGDSRSRVFFDSLSRSCTQTFWGHAMGCARFCARRLPAGRWLHGDTQWHARALNDDCCSAQSGGTRKWESCSGDQARAITQLAARLAASETRPGCPWRRDFASRLVPAVGRATAH